MPLLGSNFENGWLACKNVPGTVTVPRSKVMWFEPVSAKKADQFRHFDEIMNTPIEMTAGDDPNRLTSPFGVLDNRMPNVDFLLPNPRSEEIRSRGWIEVRAMKIGQWYSVILRRELQGSPGDMKIHVGIVHHTDEDSVTFINVTTGSPLASGPVGGQTSAEMNLPYSQIDRAIPLTAEQAAEQIAMFDRPRESLTTEGD